MKKMYINAAPQKTEFLVYHEMRNLVAPLKIRKNVNVLFEPYRSRILTAVTSGKTNVRPESVVKIMATIYSDYVRSCPYDIELYSAGSAIQRTLEYASPDNLLPVWKYYSNGNGRTYGF